ncbi:Uncharacterised protein [Kluyvera cryocrescens]|uniref:Uncharacterized protein n=1 Tax=Kluyvera cryocrescens TaxID=580 RepID=A0A485B7D2_KLUCR|nr:Uncharacterised protein [Kluyvera cryocrescens]
MLEIVRPLLAQQEKTYAALGRLAQNGASSLRLGLTTAFELGVFTALEQHLVEQVEVLNIVRHGSPELIRLIRRGGSWTRRWWRCRWKPQV